jgi:uncharacterized protein YggE
MKIKFLHLCVFVLASTILQAQEAVGRFIHVTGQAKKELTADGAVLRITISEQQPNEYARTGYIPFEAAYTNFLEELFTIDIHENQLEQNMSNIPRYNPTDSREYILTIKDLVTVDKVLAIKATGVQFTSLTYTFPVVDVSMETMLAKEAIQDARDRAAILAKDLNVKVGKVLEIQVNQSLQRDYNMNANSKTIPVSYNVSVKFEIM